MLDNCVWCKAPKNKSDQSALQFKQIKKMLKRYKNKLKQTAEDKNHQPPTGPGAERGGEFVLWMYFAPFHFSGMSYLLIYFLFWIIKSLILCHSSCTPEVSNPGTRGPLGCLPASTELI